LVVLGLQQFLDFYRLVKKRVCGGYQLISIHTSMAQARTPTLLPHYSRYVKQYCRGHTTSTRARQDAQFKLRTNKSSSLLDHAGNLNVVVKGDYAKQGVVDASRKDSNVPAHVFAMVVAPKI
jgi:hypothetical protein